MKKEVFIPQGVSVAGPYSPGVGTDGLIFFSGQIAMDNSTGKVIEGDIKAQCEQCFKNLLNLLDAAQITTKNILKTTIYLTDINDFSAVNVIYAKYFNAPYPARTAIAVAALPLGAKIEIEAIAKK